MRRVGGYNLDEFLGEETWNLAKLVVGSEGTLCTVLEAKLTSNQVLQVYAAIDISGLTADGT